jgi:hypothetical protein
MFKPVLSEHNKISEPGVKNAICQSIPVGLYGKAVMGRVFFVKRSVYQIGLWHVNELCCCAHLLYESTAHAKLYKKPT